eukprot:m.303756 g.303756  ORF g.303756 m.303756 type:complete len:429 (+) comp16436_c7_seq1:420-1706(+)
MADSIVVKQEGEEPVSLADLVPFKLQLPEGVEPWDFANQGPIVNFPEGFLPQGTGIAVSPPSETSEDSAGEDEETVVDLSLKNKNLTQISSHIFHYQTLHFLDLSCNAIESVPPGIGCLTALVHLNLSQNRIRSLPHEISKLHHLVKLDVSSNALSELPEGVWGELVAMRELRVLDNELRTLPPSLMDLRGLQKLNVAQNKLESLPHDIGRLENLEVLNCGKNMLRVVPRSLGQLHKLWFIFLGDNQLTELPIEMCSMSSLRTLNIHNNHVSYLPRDLINLTTLENLSLRGNPLVYDFINDLPTKPMSLLELCGRAIKNGNIPYDSNILPQDLVRYLDSARRCTGTNCNGVFFTHNVKSVNVVTDFCGKYRVPLMEYLCKRKCAVEKGNPKTTGTRKNCDGAKMQKVLLSGYSAPTDEDTTRQAHGHS